MIVALPLKAEPWRAALFWGVLLLATLPMLIEHLANLVVDASYGVVAVAIVAATVFLVAWRWDLRASMPNNAGTQAMLAVAVLLVPVAWQSGWQPTWYFVCLAVYAGFLWNHGDRRDGRRMGRLLLPLLALLFGSNWLGDVITRYIEQSTLSIESSMLYWCNVPHMIRADMLAIPGEWFIVPWRFQPAASWQTFLAVALVYSIMMRRSLAHCLLNAALGLLLCVLFHAGVVLTNSLAMNFELAYLDATRIPILVAAIALLVFVSSDRFVEAVLYPISADSNSPQANPLVVAWNFVAGQRSERRDKHAPRRQQNILLRQIPWVAALALIAGGSMCAAGLPQKFTALQAGTARWTPPDSLFADLAGASIEVDHATLDRTIKARWGRPADVWTWMAAEYDAELVVTQQQLSALDVESAYRREQWSISTDSEADQMPDGELPQAESTAGEGDASTPDNEQVNTAVRDALPDMIQLQFQSEQTGQRAMCLLAHMTAAGEIVAPTQQSPRDGTPLWTIHSFSRFNVQPSDRILDLQLSRFRQALDELSEALTSAPSSSNTVQ